jgi:N-acetylmuramoyl-L-alanine amidase
MLVSFRSALLVFAAATASSVAPAQVAQASSEFLVPVTNASLPKIVVPEPTDTLTSAPDETAPTETAPGSIDEAGALPVKPTGDLASMVSQLRSSDPGSRELECLAAGIYFESKGEPLAGQLAVGEVIVNRANSDRFPSTYCGVLLQRGQFSFVRGGKWPAVKKSSRQWQNAVAVARIVDQDLKDSAADNALFFHAKHVSPRWRLKRIASVGNHIFYR